MAFDDPVFALFRIGRELRLEELAAINQRQGIANTDDAAPCSLTNQLAQPKALESVGKNVAVRSGEFVDECDHWAKKGLRWISRRHAIARDPDHDEGAPKPLDHEGRNESTAVAADVDNERLLSNLREVELGKFIQTRPSHVGNMEVPDFAVGFLTNVIDIFLDPRQVVEGRFVGRWNYCHIARSIVARLRVNS